jgi:hypothetical protein
MFLPKLAWHTFFHIWHLAHLSLSANYVIMDVLLSSMPILLQFSVMANLFAMAIDHHPHAFGTLIMIPILRLQQTRARWILVTLPMLQSQPPLLLNALLFTMHQCFHLLCRLFVMLLMQIV